LILDQGHHCRFLLRLDDLDEVPESVRRPRMAEEAAERLSREIKICLSRVASAAKAVIHSTRLAARLKAAPFQNKCKAGLFRNLLRYRQVQNCSSLWFSSQLFGISTATQFQNSKFSHYREPPDGPITLTIEAILLSTLY